MIIECYERETCYLYALIEMSGLYAGLPVRVVFSLFGNKLVVTTNGGDGRLVVRQNRDTFRPKVVFKQSLE